jgi:uncharacterized protein
MVVTSTGPPAIVARAKATGDAVVLRWAPSTPHAWRVGGLLGYMIERREGNGAFQPVLQTPVLPLSGDEFVGALSDTSGERGVLAFAAMALYGDTSLVFNPEFPGRDTTGQRGVANVRYHGYALMAADRDPRAAELLGLRYVDRTVKKGVRYTYRIRLPEAADYENDPEFPDLRGYTVQAAMVVTTPGVVAVQPTAQKLRAEVLDRRVAVHWEAPEGNDYGGYRVFRASVGSGTFQRLDAVPLSPLIIEGSSRVAPFVFMDTTVVIGREYVYRVVGVDPFGDAGPPVEVTVRVVDRIPPPEPVLENPPPVVASVALRWTLPSLPSDLKEFRVSRGANPDSGFVAVHSYPLPASARFYMDTSPSRATPYYRVTAVDSAGNVAHALPVLAVWPDTLPPAAPTGLVARADSLGLVQLRWRRNPEAWVAGYRLQSAPRPDQDFATVTGAILKDTSYTDTIATRTLDRALYYRVVALSSGYAPSQPSAVVRLVRPDRVPPQSAAIGSVGVTDSSVVLNLVASPSDDVRVMYLQRRAQGQTAWTVRDSFPAGRLRHEDLGVVSGRGYEYRVVVQDSSGWWSPPSNSVMARPFDSGRRPAVTDVNAVFERGRRTVRLSWVYRPVRDEPFTFVVYRRVKGGSWLELRTLERAARTYSDRELDGSGTYDYALLVRGERGAQSPLSASAQTTVILE